MMYFLRSIPEPTFYSDISLWDYTVVAFIWFGVLLFFRLIQYFTSGVSKNNSLDFTTENRIVSPFLIDEQSKGEVIISNTKNPRFVRVVAFVLILFFLAIPLWEMFHEVPGYFNKFYM